MKWMCLKGSVRVAVSMALGLVGGNGWGQSAEKTDPPCPISGPQCDAQATLLSDLACRLKILPVRNDDKNKSCYQSDKGTGTQGCGTWGPAVHDYLAPQPEAGTSCSLQEPAWQRQRLVAFADQIVLKQYNYCHHHVPTWIPPEEYRNPGPGKGMTCTPNRNTQGTQWVSGQKPFTPKDIQWQGFDCSDFTTYLYDLALGVHHAQLSSGIAQQACNQGETDSTGILLDINANNLPDTGRELQPGDLLYIMANPSKGATNISHVVVWTGLTYGQLAQRSDAQIVLGADLKKYNGGALPPNETPMIVDSHYAGAAYRPFLGWYKKSLSHVRRIIGHYPGSKQEPLPKGVAMLKVCDSSSACGSQPSCAPVFNTSTRVASCTRPADFLTREACH